MGLRQRFLAGTARQLGHPRGWQGRLIARGLNRSNRSAVRAAAEASGAGPGQVVADIGFGGGIGLRELLARVGPAGRVDGVDVSTTMVDRARGAFAAECAAGRLHLAVGSMVDLPLPDRALDAVITVNTVYFLDDVGPAFRELARVLKPGGRLVVGIGDPDAMARMPVTAQGFRLRPVEELLGALAEAGFVRPRAERLAGGPLGGHLLLGET